MPHSPLPWLIAAEAALLLALGFAGWHLVSSRLAPPAAAPAAIAPAAPPRRAVARPTPSASATPAGRLSPTARPTAGLSTDLAFWQRNLTQINRDEAAWERVQVHAAEAVESFARAYIRAVVLPAVEAAAHAS